MKVAVIGEYESPDYSQKVKAVELLYPEDTILDLGRHTSKNWQKLLNLKFQDIENAHIVVNVCVNFTDDNKIDVKIDLGQAENRSKDMYQLTSEGKIVPFGKNFHW